MEQGLYVAFKFFFGGFAGCSPCVAKEFFQFAVDGFCAVYSAFGNLAHGGVKLKRVRVCYVGGLYSQVPDEFPKLTASFKKDVQVDKVLIAVLEFFYVKVLEEKLQFFTAKSNARSMKPCFLYRHR
jgi:hypothetical protein